MNKKVHQKLIQKRETAQIKTLKTLLKYFKSIF
jgi:hypothetical protein